VATAALKELRDPDSSEVTGEPHRGTYLGVYWVLDGYHDVWNRWAVDQVMALHKAGGCSPNATTSTPCSTATPGSTSATPTGSPAELALDHPSAGLVAVFTERADDLSAADFEAWQRQEHLPSLLPGTAARLVIAADPLPLLMDAPGDVPRTEADDRRQMTLWFLDTDPAAGLGRGHRRPPDGHRVLGPGSGRGRPALSSHHSRHRHLHRQLWTDTRRSS
jgi:hypothetical protein